MKAYFGDLSFSTKKKLEIVDVTSNVENVVKKSGVTNGFVNIWVPHATAAITVNENDRDLWEDILQTFERLVPLNANYQHNLKYSWSSAEQNAHAHIISCLVKPNVTVPLKNGKVHLGTWQSILFVELDGPRTRTVNVQIIGE